MTLQEARQESITQLTGIYPHSEAEAIVELLLEWITGIDRSQKSVHRQTVLTGDQVLQLNDSMPRLMAHEPIQYITNQAWFCGMLFYVDKNVLIPRPETEELVEWVIGNCRFPLKELSILDIGSGSGCIPISLKKRLNKATVVSCDISTAALDVARRNAAQLGIDAKFLELNILDIQQREQLGKFDFIISNPPYIPLEEKSKLDINVVAYEPPQALFVPDEDPFLFYRIIGEMGKNHLNPRGLIIVEMHEDLASDCDALFKSQGYQTEIRKDMQGKDRLLKASV